MSNTKEIRSEIQEMLERVPDEVLEDIRDYLKEVQGQPDQKVKLWQNFRKILEEDKRLLEILAD